VTLSDQYDHVLIRVRRRDLALVEAVVIDPGGNRLRFQFSDFRFDRGIAESLFDLGPDPAERRAPKPTARPAAPAQRFRTHP
jgi:hypothetical protein